MEGLWSYYGVVNIQELLLGWSHPPVPGTGPIKIHETGRVLGLGSALAIVQQPVCPKALIWGADGTGEGRAADDL